VDEGELSAGADCARTNGTAAVSPKAAVRTSMERLSEEN
jgi:hypothetical protein